MRKALRVVMFVAVPLLLAGCSGKSGAPNPSASDGPAAQAPAPATTAPAAEAPAPAPAPAPASPNAALRDGIKAWVELAGKCERRWFSKVDPDKLDRWELPVDVPSMEDECDKLIFDHETLVKDNLFRGAALDSLFGRMALATDLYTHLALRCRKVGVKDRLPFKQMISGLRDGLNAEIDGITKDAEALLALPDDQMIAVENGAALVARADGNLGRVASDMDTFVVKPRKAVGPVFKYCLTVSGRLADLSAAAVAGDASADQKYRDAASALAKEWGVVSGFYAGDYLAEEEAKAAFLAKDLKKAVSAYEKAASAVRKSK